MENKLEQAISNTPPVTEPANPKIQFLRVMEEKLRYALGPTDKTFIEIVRDPKSIDELLKRQSKIGQKDFVMAVGMIASAVKKNRNYLGKKIFYKYYLESGEDIFEKAMDQLRSWEVKPTNQSKYTPEAWQERIEAAERAHAWLRSFEKPEESTEQPEIEQPASEEIVASVLDFEVLPKPRQGESDTRMTWLQEFFGTNKLDQDRINFLLKYADEYNGELFVSKLGKGDTSGDPTVKISLEKEAESDLGFKYNYLVAVFDTETPLGVRKFALAEWVKQNRAKKEGNPEEREAVGAMYLFEETHGSAIWQSVLSQTIKVAKDLGAQQITHHVNFEERLKKHLATEKAEAATAQ